MSDDIVGCVPCAEHAKAMNVQVGETTDLDNGLISIWDLRAELVEYHEAGHG